MAEIILPSGHIVLLDDEDWDWVASFNWYAYGTHKTKYAGRTQKLDHRRYCVAMHNQIMQRIASYYIVIDHLNGNGLDNRKDNFEVVTQKENILRGFRK